MVFEYTFAPRLTEGISLQIEMLVDCRNTCVTDPRHGADKASHFTPCNHDLTETNGFAGGAFSLSFKS